VKAYEYWEYMTGEYEIKIRRLKGASEAQRSKLAYHAATYVSTHYGFLNIVNIADSLNSGDSWKRRIFASKGIICSQLYFEAAMRIGYLLATIPAHSVCPAHLSMTPLLEDVPLSWVKV